MTSSWTEVQSEDPEPNLMAALGQKLTFASQNVTSASPPIATAKADISNPPCPLYPQKQTCAAQTVMSALGQ